MRIPLDEFLAYLVGAGFIYVFFALIETIFGWSQSFLLFSLIYWDFQFMVILFIHWLKDR